jgi:hypothetical protein
VSFRAFRGYYLSLQSARRAKRLDVSRPEGSDEKGVGVVGEVQRGYSGPSDWRLADDP